MVLIRLPSKEKNYIINFKDRIMSVGRLISYNKGLEDQFYTQQVDQKNTAITQITQQKAHCQAQLTALRLTPQSTLRNKNVDDDDENTPRQRPKC